MKLVVSLVVLMLAAGNGQVLLGSSLTTAVMQVNRGGVELEVPLRLGVLGIATKLPWLGRKINESIIAMLGKYEDPLAASTALQHYFKFKADYLNMLKLANVHVSLDDRAALWIATKLPSRGRKINESVIGMLGKYEDPLAASTALQHYFKFKADYLNVLKLANVHVSLDDRAALWTMRLGENFVRRISTSLRDEPALASAAAEQIADAETLLRQQRQLLEEVEVDDLATLTAQEANKLHESAAERDIITLLEAVDSLEERREIIVMAATAAWLRKQLIDSDMSSPSTVVRDGFGTLQQERDEIERYWQFWAALYQEQ